MLMLACGSVCLHPSIVASFKEMSHQNLIIHQSNNCPLDSLSGNRGMHQKLIASIVFLKMLFHVGGWLENHACAELCSLSHCGEQRVKHQCCSAAP